MAEAAESKTVLVIGSEITAPFLIMALRRLGWNTLEDESGLAGAVPDLIIGVNEKERTEQLARKYRKPKAIWFTDLHADIFRSAQGYEFTQTEESETFFFCFSPQQAEWFSNAGMPFVEYLPPAVDPEFFFPRQRGEELGSLISFMGEVRLHSQNRMQQMLRELQASIPDNDFEGLKDFLLSFSDELADDFTPGDPQDFFVALKEHCPQKCLSHVEQYPAYSWARAVENQVNAVQRVKLCRALEHEGLRIWGTLADWENAGKWSCHAGRRALFFDEWPLIICNSRMCLNLFRPAVWHGIPQKAMEIAAGGSLLVSNDHPNLRCAFTPGKECLVFKTVEECREIVRWVKDDPDQFSHMVRSARDRVLREHTYLHRAQRIIDCLTTHDFL